MHAAELVGNPSNHWKVPRDWWIVSQLPASMAYDVSDDKRGRFKLRSVAPDNACAAAAFPWRTLTWLMSYCVEPQLHQIAQELAARCQQFLAQLLSIGQRLAAHLQHLTDQVQQTWAKGG
jgi:hypothetical protein